MSELILPPTLAVLLTAFTSCFQARSSLTFQWLVLGWVQCQGRRTLTEVALASGAIGERHISVFHRFFSRASWTLDALGRAVFTLLLTWLPADQPLVIVGDDTLARKTGKSIALASMHHDPLLSSARKPFASFGHVWVVLAVWVPLPFGTGRGFASPVLFRLYVSAKRGGERHRSGQTQTRTGPRLHAARTAHAEQRHATKLELLREMISLVAHCWPAERVRGRGQCVRGSDRAGGPPVQCAGGQPPPLGRGAVCPSTATAPRPEGAAATAWGPFASPGAGDRSAAALDRTPTGAVRPCHHAADLHAGCAVVRCPPHAAHPYCGGARSEWATPR